MKIDLGCGYNKQPGYVGIDRFQTPDTQIVCDIDEGLPLEENSVTYLIASHSLEHVGDLMETMEEIYRVCQHKAIVVIAAPYYQTSLNVANPYHKHAFNEHTARFFTNDPESLIPEEDYYFPHAVAWGLGSSDNSNLKMDFRCIKMEYFYFPEYQALSEEAKRSARQHSFNVVDQILIHLVVVKEDISKVELLDIQTGPLEEPQHVTLRRLRELNEQNVIKLHSAELAKQAADSERKIAEESQREYFTRNLEGHLAELKDGLKLLQNEIGKLKKEPSIDNTAEESYRTVNEVNATSLDPGSAKSIWTSLVALESNKWNRVRERGKRILNNKWNDLSLFINDSCKTLVAQNILQSNKDLNDYVLNKSQSIGWKDIIFYKVHPKTNKWKGLKAIFLNFQSPPLVHSVALEILDSEMRILRSVHSRDAIIHHEVQTEFSFDELEGSAEQTYYIRFVGMRPDLWGVQIYEWTKYNRLGKKADSSFCGELLF
ncbi:class I SAM-dependent methyltransferase [Cohnella sp. GCM10012308]|uniref:class I SAM-dependent methyltransferase n=1 Tax=Cohnella sp. GCM10012308 TaxID=3317329 RepID=UPI0036226CC8